jgi:2,3-bisphosphoglycerate-independent phosphoglycerate mutase
MTKVTRAVLVVLDGFGAAPPGPGNAPYLANTPVLDDLKRRYAYTELTASGRAVGLPEGQMGNSEVGHMNLGAGTVVMQDLTRIDIAVERGELAKNDVLRAAFQAGAASRVHLVGLTSGGGVHSSLEQLKALIRLGAELGVNDVVVHAFTDGRDTLPHSGAGFLDEIEQVTAQTGAGRVASVIGRYYGMDRDQRWQRTQLAYDLLVQGQAEHHADSAVAAIKGAYERGETDEFIRPITIGEEGRIRPGDSVIAFNFRPDRMRQITRALAEPGFTEVDRGGVEPIASYTTLTQYKAEWPYPVAFAPDRPKLTLPQVIAEHKQQQLHVAETEKYPHVTYFFGGGEETPQVGERREMAPSPREIPTYDYKPQMAAPEVAQKFIGAWFEDRPAFGIINFANSDMVGHTGVIPAAVKAVETIDYWLGRIVEAVQALDGALLITADHGNSDHMLELDGSANTQHSMAPVPVILTEPAVKLRGDGALADVAPTLLQVLGYDQPAEMTGKSLLI